MNDEIIKLKAEIFDIQIQIENMMNIKKQKLQQLQQKIQEIQKRKDEQMAKSNHSTKK